jgi:hypothetical protein
MIQDLIYEALLARLKQKATSLRTIDWFNQNLLNLVEGEELPYNTPAAFIEFMPIEPVTHGKLKQLEPVTFNVILIDEILQESGSLATAAERKQSLQLHSVARELQKALVGYCSDAFGTISSTSTTTDHDFTNINGLVLAFRCLAINNENIPETTEVEANLKVTQGRCY